jgi:hypothetical protein
VSNSFYVHPFPPTTKSFAILLFFIFPINGVIKYIDFGFGFLYREKNEFKIHIIACINNVFLLFAQ